jgi:hypothetical protein
MIFDANFPWAWKRRGHFWNTVNNVYIVMHECRNFEHNTYMVAFSIIVSFETLVALIAI